MNDDALKKLGEDIKEAGSRARYSDAIGAAIIVGAFIVAGELDALADNPSVDCGDMDLATCFAQVAPGLQAAGVIKTTDLKKEAKNIKWTLAPQPK